ncbi:hypothetical protein M0R89_06200 [Halorussus limi]|uniref:DUF8107 domain-containing protein n=1 Tax=Halorussus limi TaxID=2938695 RepID=A0A8U0HY23_9EURY|nr:hypothetical protein [Halorussus limi]UPV75653.1 hypothetical protein M0R89_06200 [Halorussus limi]
MANSKGDPRVLFLMNLVLSAAFATLVVWGLSRVGLLAFAWQTVAFAAGVLMVLTYLVVQ